MCRAIFPYELGDPDFAWLLATFQESHPGFVLVDSTCLPLILVDMKDSQPAAAEAQPEQALIGPQDIPTDRAEK